MTSNQLSSDTELNPFMFKTDLQQYLLLEGPLSNEHGAKSIPLVTQIVLI